MRKFSTLIHLKDKSQAIAGTLDALRVSDELLVIDHVATDEMRELLRKHGATVLKAIDGVHDGAYATNARNEWVLCVRPFEHPDAELCTALEGWKQLDPAKDDRVVGYTIAIDSQRQSHAVNGAHRELRFVNRTRINWIEDLPGSASNVLSLPGSLLRAA